MDNIGCTGREQTLDEWVNRLPLSHSARKELAQLRTQLQDTLRSRNEFSKSLGECQRRLAECKETCAEYIRETDPLFGQLEKLEDENSSLREKL
jgi:chromosome segregation ATPase